MHYKNGKEAHLGDPVIGPCAYNQSRFIAGTLGYIEPGMSACNSKIIFATVGGVDKEIVTVGECYHVEDAFELIAELGKHLKSDCRYVSARVMQLEDLLTSAMAITTRKGKDTAWGLFFDRLREAGIGSVTEKPFLTASEC